MRIILVALAVGLATMGPLWGVDCSEYKDRARKNEQAKDWHSYWRPLERKSAEDPCVDYARGLYFRGQNRVDSARAHFQKALERNPDFYGSYMEMGFLYHAQRDFRKARQYFDQAISIAQKSGDRSGEGWSKSRMADLYLHYRAPEEALTYATDAVKLAGIAHNPDLETWALTLMEEALIALGEFSEAEEKGRQALSMRIAMHHSKIWYAHEMLGNLCLAAGDAAEERDRAGDYYTKAIEQYTQAIDVAGELIQKQRLSVMLGDAYLRRGEPDTALRYYESFLKDAPRQNNIAAQSRIQAYGRIGEIYLARGHYPDALAYLQRAVDEAREDRTKNLEMSWLKRVGDVYSTIGDYDNALAHYRRITEEIADGFLDLRLRVSAVQKSRTACTRFCDEPEKEKLANRGD